MPLPNVVFEIIRDGLGQVAFTEDGIMGIVLTGASVQGGVTVDTPYAINSLQDAEALLILSSNANAAAHKQIEDFYAEAGNGVKLWILVSNAATMSTKVASGASPAKKLLDKAQGEICVLGLTQGATQSTVIVDGLNEDVILTMTYLQTMADAYEGKIMPFSGIIEGIGFSGVAADVPNLKALSRHRCSVLLCSNLNTGTKPASIGEFLGRLASIPVQRKASRVKDGPLNISAAYLTDGATVDGREGDLGTLHDKGYIVYRTFAKRPGSYYYSGDPTAVAATDDLNTIARNRIIDKAVKIAYNVYVDELDDDVDITEQGNVAPAVVGNLKTKIELQVNGNMANEISNFYAVINPAQNILSGLPFEIELNITPRGYLGNIKVKIGFINPLNI